MPPDSPRLPDVTEPRRPSGADPVYVPIGPRRDEDESGHLDRVAAELAAGDLPRVRRLQDVLATARGPARMQAAADLAGIGGRNAISTLRSLLEGSDPEAWAAAVHGLRLSKDRSGWLCLESVALDSVGELGSADRAERTRAALRLLMMGRTKTMDRLFRAVDGHSRAIPQAAARTFAEAAVASLPAEQGRVLAMRLGLAGGHSRTPPEIALLTGLTEERVRDLEAEAWAAVQSPRPWADLGRSADFGYHGGPMRGM